MKLQRDHRRFFFVPPWLKNSVSSLSFEGFGTSKERLSFFISLPGVEKLGLSSTSGMCIETLTPFG